MKSGRWNWLILLIAGILFAAVGTLGLVLGQTLGAGLLALGLILAAGSIWLRRQRLP